MTGADTVTMFGEGELADSVAEIAVLVGSPHRVELLRALYDRDGCTRDELRALVDASRTTVRRNVQALEERGWITDAAREYTLTPAGALVTEELLGLVETMGLAADLRQALRWLPREELGFDLRALHDAHVTVGSPTNPYAPIRRLAESLETAAGFRGVFPAASLAAVDVAHVGLLVDDADWTVVLGAAARDALESTPTYADRFDELRGAGPLDLYSVSEPVPFYLGLLDDEVQLGIENGDGVLKALIQSDSAAVHDWADDVFADYRARSAPVE